MIITVVYAPYFAGVVAEGADEAKAWWGWTLAASQVVVIGLSPWLGAVGDALAGKKWFLVGTALGCSLFTALLGVAGPGMVLAALVLLAVANVCYSLGENFCASFLPEISTPESAGRISGYGWSFGYMGGLLSLLMALAIVLPEGGGDRVVWVFALTGAFFLLASLPTFLLLKERAEPKPHKGGGSLLLESWGEVARTGRTVWREHPGLGWFLVCFMMMMCGLTAIIAYAALFAQEEFGFTQPEVIGLFASLQLSSAAGAFGFGYLQDRVGSKTALVVALLLWLVVSVGAYGCEGKVLFFVIGNLAGLGMGSLQSASRAVVSMLTPREQAGEFFGFWGLFGKLGAVVGPALMGTVASTVGFREAFLINGLFFLTGLAMLAALNLSKPQDLDAA